MFSKWPPCSFLPSVEDLQWYYSNIFWLWPSHGLLYVMFTFASSYDGHSTFTSEHLYFLSSCWWTPSSMQLTTSFIQCTAVLKTEYALLLNCLPTWHPRDHFCLCIGSICFPLEGYDAFMCYISARCSPSRHASCIWLWGWPVQVLVKERILQ